MNIYEQQAAESLAKLVTPLAVSESGAAGNGAYAPIGTTVLSGLYDWIAVEVACAAADMTGDGFKVEKIAASGGAVLPWLAGAQWADGSQFGEHEESGVDDDGDGHYVYQLDTGESAFVRLCVTGLYSVKFSAIGNGATITIAGSATKGG